MTELPRLSICLVTYKRTAEALLTVRSCIQNLGYPKELRSFYIGDDGSPGEHLNAILGALEGEHILGYHNARMRPAGLENTYFAGMGWNKALGIGHQNSDFVLWLEDDWHLNSPLDIVPYVKLLQEREDIGMVRLGHLAVGNNVKIVGHGGIHYLEYLRGTQYAYSGNPHIRHGRFTRHYGWFSEHCTPGEIELDYDARFQANPGPAIWRPADIPAWGIYGHIGTDKTWA